ncbi:hypothetical protein RZS08_45725, partial [Arthrospira platensis SPKY1]|nr:hypothetical protein [Arthrospira platensis SPKY1]
QLFQHCHPPRGAVLARAQRVAQHAGAEARPCHVQRIQPDFMRAFLVEAAALVEQAALQVVHAEHRRARLGQLEADDSLARERVWSVLMQDKAGRRRARRRTGHAGPVHR